MKISFWNNIKGGTTYTYELLKHLAVKNGHELTHHDNSDFICVSLTSHYEINELRKCRIKYPKSIIVVGGHASNAPLSLLVYANYVNLGQGFEFFRDINNNFADLPYIISDKKRIGTYSQYVDWGKLPVVQISKNSYSYLESIGCKNKCKFCLTSWLNKHEINPSENTLKQIENKLRNKQLYFIGNNYEQFSCNLKVSDTTIKGYNSNSNKYKGITLIRVGLESISEKTRKSLGKIITDIEVKEFLERTKYFSKQTNVFLIAGLDNQGIWEKFIDILPYQPIDNKPRLGIIINYFDPSMGTPFARSPLTEIIPINIPKIKRIWKNHNARISIFRDLKVSWKNSTIDSLIQRSININQIEYLLKLKKIVFNDIDIFHKELIKNGFQKQLDGTFDYPIQLKNYHNKNFW